MAKSIIEESVDLTRNHLKKHFVDQENYPINICVYNLDKIHIDLISYTNIFYSAIFTNKFFDKYDRFPGVNEINESIEGVKILLKEFEKEFVNYKINGNVNVINLS